jgi:single-strand DNA-binding protein
MANLNKVMLIGRLTRKPESIANDKGAKFGFAVNNRKLNQTTGQWEDEPVFIDCEIWNRGENGQQATRVLQTLDKGQQIFIEGRLKYDTWTEAPEKGGAKRSALRVVVENFQYLEPRQDGGEGGPRPTATRSAAPARSGASNGSGGYSRPSGGYNGGGDEYGDEPAAPSTGRSRPPVADGNEDDIPF